MRLQGEVNLENLWESFPAVKRLSSNIRILSFEIIFNIQCTIQYLSLSFEIIFLWNNLSFEIILNIQYNIQYSLFSLDFEGENCVLSSQSIPK